MGKRDEVHGKQFGGVNEEDERRDRMTAKQLEAVMEEDAKRARLCDVADKILFAAQTDSNALFDLLPVLQKLEVQGSTEVFSPGDDATRHIELVFNKNAFDLAHMYNQRLRKLCAQGIKQTGSARLAELYKQSLRFDAMYDFDAAIRFMEFDRPFERKFYEPRRKSLKPVADELTRLAKYDYDLLGISLPPGTGKTTMAEFFVAWLAGKNSSLTNLICSHNNEFLKGLYQEMLRITDPTGEYLWQELFPNVAKVSTNAKDLRLDFGTGKRFETIELTSVGSNNAGKVRATGLLYCDDLVSGIEQAMSKDQMDKLWNQYTTDLRQRKQGKFVRELHIATRWSVHDPLGRLEEMNEHNPRAKFIRIPAMNEKDESNFDYPFGLGFSTAMYRDQRTIMDPLSWRALYMNDPIEREGLLYESSELRRYFDLPEGEPDAIIAVCDSKEQGDDYCAMPILYKYGPDYYLDKWFCDNGKVEIHEERIAELLTERGVHACQIESNRGGTIFAANVRDKVKAKGGITTITTKWNQTNKETRIQVYSGWVKEHVLFRDESCYDREYRTAMTMLTNYTMAGKNKHDDVPDVLASVASYSKAMAGAKAKVMKRFF